MEKVSFNQGWRVATFDNGKTGEFVSCRVPDDRMIREERSPEAEGGVNTAWFLCHDYVYEKEFDKPVIEEGGKAILCFEGVYRNAEIFLDGEAIFKNDYGYNTFYVDITDKLKEGKNLISVVAHNADQPNSRWYTGTGIYRPVWLYILPKDRIELNSLRVTTLDYKSGKLRLEGQISGEGEIAYEIINPAGEAVLKGVFKDSAEVVVPSPELWSAEHPSLYTLKCEYKGDLQEIRFGIRQIEWGDFGYRINGERLLLKGACQHADNGLLGAVTLRDIEFWKVKKLKELGYNAIRMSHHPMCTDMLDACDELGMYVMNEYVDCWYIHKTKYDYVNEIMDNYDEDIRLLVLNAYNHPSVVLYSSGNEVSETAYPRGIEFTKTLTETFHKYDPTRPVACAVNIFFNALSTLGFGVYSDDKADSNKQAKAKKKSVGSQFFNNMANFFGSEVMLTGSRLGICDRKTRDSFANVDVAGYNYARKRYKKDLKKYPHRLILGSETFCADTKIFLEAAEKHERVIGDFVWAGFDYLGECGIGAWINENDAPSFDHGCGWMTAGQGRLDITGRPLGEALYTQVMYGVKPLEMAIVSPYEKASKHSPSAWKLSLAMPYYSFDEKWIGKHGVAEIYSKDHRVELFINGKKVGAKVVNKKTGIAKINFKYEPGTITAKSFTKSGEKVAEVSLKSAGKENVLTYVNEPGTGKYRYVRLRFGDKKGVIKPELNGFIKISNVKNGSLLAFGNGSPYHEESYLGDKVKVYQGEALAIFEVEEGKKLSFTATSDFGKIEYWN